MHDTERAIPDSKFTPPARGAAAAIDAHSTVNDVIRLHPVAVRVFNAFGVDACCGGAASLTEAARDANIPLDALLDALVGALTDDAVEEAT
jgi:regulator of cell morphogenesis and NO signaling